MADTTSQRTPSKLSSHAEQTQVSCCLDFFRFQSCGLQTERWRNCCVVHLLVLELTTLLHHWLHLHHLSCHLLQLFDTHETRVDEQMTGKGRAFKSSMAVSVQRCLDLHNTSQERAQGTTPKVSCVLFPTEISSMGNRDYVRGTVVVDLCTHSSVSPHQTTNRVRIVGKRTKTRLNYRLHHHACPSFVSLESRGFGSWLLGSKYSMCSRRCCRFDAKQNERGTDKTRSAHRNCLFLHRTSSATPRIVNSPTVNRSSFHNRN